jgi:hypothetical protein
MFLKAKRYGVDVVNDRSKEKNRHNGNAAVFIEARPPMGALESALLYHFHS